MSDIIYHMCDESCEISKWKLNSYQLRLSHKNPDEYSRSYLNIKQPNSFYEIIFNFSCENKNDHRIDIELDLHKRYFRLNNHWACTINSLRFTKKKDYADFRKKLDVINIEVKKLFTDYFKNDEDIEYYYNDYIYQVGEDIKENLCKGKVLKSFDIN